MEPVAVYIQNYWTWYDTGLYYGVPEANFVAWGLISLVMVALLNRLTVAGSPTRTGERLKFLFIPLALYLMNLTMFTLVNFSHGNYLAGAIGLLVALSCFVLILGTARKRRGIPSTGSPEANSLIPESVQNRPIQAKGKSDFKF